MEGMYDNKKGTNYKFAPAKKPEDFQNETK